VFFSKNIYLCGVFHYGIDETLYFSINKYLSMSQLNFLGRLDYKNKSVSVNLGMYLFKEGKSYIVYCPALDLSAYGDTENDARQSFVGIFESSLMYMLNKNTLKEDLINHGWKIKSMNQKKIKAPSFDTMLKNNDSFREILENKEYTTYFQTVGIPEFA